MTPRERAKKIYGLLHWGCGCCGYQTEAAAKSILAAQIEEAVEQATSAGYFGEIILAKMLSAKAAAYEDAAKIAETFKLSDYPQEWSWARADKFNVEHWIAKAIRTRAKEIA